MQALLKLSRGVDWLNTQVGKYVAGTRRDLDSINDAAALDVVVVVGQGDGGKNGHHAHHDHEFEECESTLKRGARHLQPITARTSCPRTRLESQRRQVER